MKLWLVRHAHPEMQPEASSHTWGLSERGKSEAQATAAWLARQTLPPEIVLTSAEPKAVQTGAPIAQACGVSANVLEDLGEQHRETAPWLPIEEFRASVQRIFTQPEDLVFGEETGAAAAERFARALRTIERQHPGAKSAALVTHGTILTAWLHREGWIEDPVAFWRELTFAQVVELVEGGVRVHRP